MADVGFEVFDVAQIDLAGGEETANVADADFEAALVGLGDHDVDDLSDFDLVPVAGEFLDSAGDAYEEQAFFGIVTVEDDLE